MRRQICIALSFALMTTATRAALTVNSSVDEVLDALQSAGRDLKSFSAEVKHTKTDNTGADVTDAGKLIYQNQVGKDVRARISFETRQMGDSPPKPGKKLYQLENGTLTIRDPAVLSEEVQQITPAGQRTDLFDLGKGLFPLPLGQEKKTVLAQFDVIKVPPVKDDPAGTIHLILKPKPNTKMAGQYSAVDLFVDLSKSMPIRIDTTNVRGDSSTSTRFLDLSINPALADADFTLTQVPKNWRQHIVPPPTRN